MVARSSLFAQVVSRISRRAFDAAVREHGAEKGAKGFTCWEQFVAMLYAQMAGAHSCGRFAAAWPRRCGTRSHGRIHLGQQ